MTYYYTCPVCNGYGVLNLDREELYSLLRSYLYAELNCRDRIDIIKQWIDRCGQIDCPECDGNGEIDHIKYH